MFIWLLAIVVIGAFAALGFTKGAIRMGVSALGVFIGLSAAGPLGKVMEPLFPKLGTQNLVWLSLLPPLVAFLIIWAVFIVIGFVAQRPVELHYKYKEDDLTRKGFESMSKAIGLFVGLFTGIVLFFFLGQRVYAAGYLTTQTSSDTEPPTIDYLNKVRRDMQTAGWDRVFAATDKTSANYYQVADVLGLLYHNPLIHGRAANYPPFLQLADRPEFQDIGSDNDLLKQLQEGAGFMQVVSNPKVQAILKNEELTQSLLKIDLQDFRTYLETGKSPKYDDERILGRWRPDPIAIINHLKRTRQNISGVELQGLRIAISTYFADATLTAYTDNRYVMKVTPPAAPAEPTPAEGSEAAAAPLPQGLDPTLAQRYGIRPGTRPGTTPTPAPAPITAPTPAVPQLDFSTEGTWKRQGDKYELTSKNKAGQDEVLEASISETGRLVIPIPAAKLSLFFVRRI